MALGPIDGRDNRERSALSQLSQCLADALFGLAGLLFALPLLLFESLHCRQKPRRFWLAIDHGDLSFQNASGLRSRFPLELSPTRPTCMFHYLILWCRLGQLSTKNSRFSEMASPEPQ